MANVRYHLPMHIGMIGLGRMGGNMAQRLARHGIDVTGYSRPPIPVLPDEPRIRIVATLDELIRALPAPRIVWLMVPAGEATEENVEALATRLASGDLVIDGGNAFYRDSQRRAQQLAARGIGFLDAGVSGGVWGLTEGYGMMVGGERAHFERILPLVRALAPAPDRGWVYCGPVGAGHYTKMVHNGIEYGLMQAYAEGFALLAARKDLALPLGEIAEAWRHGTVIRSWLLDLTAGVLREPAALARVGARIADSGEGRWTAREAIDLGVPAPVISAALMTRFASQGADDFGARLLALVRNAFGGHPLPPATAPDPKARPPDR
ncbi:MAG: 6-phosphogluconate dehydrogenase, NAD(+)-dependent, decarboxylating [Steroidobacteraceae bacterium]|nr:6-phosphogluconate dehydrogenase, NAD(+)-dependent, decarboxylating [Steroidobacteraceae bacterium]